MDAGVEIELGSVGGLDESSFSEEKNLNLDEAEEEERGRSEKIGLALGFKGD